MFYVLLLKQDITKKGRINKFAMPEFEVGDNKEYKVEAIHEDAVHAKKANRHLLRLYYLVAWKGYPEEKDTWNPFSTVMHLWKMVSTFHKDPLEKPTVISALLNSDPPMAKPTLQLSAKRKRGQLKRCATKCAKWGDKEESKSV